jgi:hypothetical protein
MLVKRAKMKSEAWVRDYLQSSEDLLRKAEMSELTDEDIREWMAGDPLVERFVARVACTFRNHTLREVLDLDGFKEWNEKVRRIIIKENRQ